MNLLKTILPLSVIGLFSFSVFANPPQSVDCSELLSIEGKKNGIDYNVKNPWVMAEESGFNDSKEKMLAAMLAVTMADNQKWSEAFFHLTLKTASGFDFDGLPKNPYLRNVEYNEFTRFFFSNLLKIASGDRLNGLSSTNPLSSWITNNQRHLRTSQILQSMAELYESSKSPSVRSQIVSVVKEFFTKNPLSALYAPGLEEFIYAARSEADLTDKTKFLTEIGRVFLESHAAGFQRQFTEFLKSRDESAIEKTIFQMMLKPHGIVFASSLRDEFSNFSPELQNKIREFLKKMSGPGGEGSFARVWALHPDLEFIVR